MKKRKPAKTPMQQAIARLFEVGACAATPEQMLAVAEEFEVEVSALEGFYFDAVAEAAEEDRS